MYYRDNHKIQCYHSALDQELHIQNYNYSLTSRSIVTSEIYSLMDRSRASWYFVNVEGLGFKTADINWFAECGFKKQGQPEL